MSRAPTTADAAMRRVVRLADGRTGRLLALIARGRAKVSLPSGAMLTVSLADVEVVPDTLDQALARARSVIAGRGQDPAWQARHDQVVASWREGLAALGLHLTPAMLRPMVAMALSMPALMGEGPSDPESMRKLGERHAAVLIALVGLFPEEAP